MSEQSTQSQAIPRPGRGLPRLDVLMALGDQVLVSGITFLVGILVARHLGITEFGRMAMVLILQMFAQSLQGCFVVAPMMSLAGMRARRSTSYFASVVAASSGLSVIAGMGVAMATGLIYGLRDGAVPWDLALSAGAFTVTQNITYTVRRMLFAKRAGWQAFVMDAVRYLIFVGLLLVPWMQARPIDVSTVLWAMAASGLVALVPAALRLRRARLRPLLVRTMWGRHWPYARWLALMMVLVFSQEQAIALGLGAVLSDEAIGGLRAGQYLIGVTHFIWVTLENFVPSGAARAHASGGVPALRAFLKDTTLTLGVVVWGFILLVSVPAEFSLRLAFGAGYEQYAPVLRIYGLTYAIAFSREVWVFFFYATERTEVIFRAFSLGFVVAAIAFIPAIKLLGITGAALTVLLANVTSTGFVMWSAWRAIAESGKPAVAAPSLAPGAGA